MDHKQLFNHYKQLGIIPKKEVTYHFDNDQWKASFKYNNRTFNSSARTKGEAFSHLARAVHEEVTTTTASKDVVGSKDMQETETCYATFPQTWTIESLMKAGGSVTVTLSFNGEAYLAILDIKPPKKSGLSRWTKKGYYPIDKTPNDAIDSLMEEFNTQ